MSPIALLKLLRAGAGPNPNPPCNKVGTGAGAGAGAGAAAGAGEGVATGAGVGLAEATGVKIKAGASGAGVHVPAVVETHIATGALAADFAGSLLVHEASAAHEPERTISESNLRVVIRAPIES